MPTPRNIIHLVPKNLWEVGGMLVPQAYLDYHMAQYQSGHNAQLTRLYEAEKDPWPWSQGLSDGVSEKQTS